MSKKYADWTDWAGDHPAQAAAESWNRSKAAALNISASGIDYTEPEDDEVCQHTEVYSTGHCADCEEPVEGFEPTDAEIFAHYGQTKITGEAA